MGTKNARRDITASKLLPRICQYMRYVLRVGLGISAFVFGWTSFMYAVVNLHEPTFSAVWPIKVYYLILFVVMFFVPIESGLNRAFLFTLLSSLLMSFGLILLVGRNIEWVSDTRLFVDGVPTLSGAIMQVSMTTVLLMSAAGITQILRQLFQILLRIKASSEELG